MYQNAGPIVKKLVRLLLEKYSNSVVKKNNDILIQIPDMSLEIIDGVNVLS